MVKLAAAMQPSTFIKDCRRDDYTLIHQCAIDDNLDALHKLSQLAYFHEVVNDDSNSDGWTPLLQAVTRSNKTDFQIVNFLVKHGADLKKPKKKDGLTALHIAASTNDIQLLDFVLQNVQHHERQEFINTKNLEGWSALHFAAFLNNFDSMSYLLDNGADLMQKNGSYMTPVDEIIRNDHKDLFSCVYERVKHLDRDYSQPGSFGMMHLAAS